ncbi:hypothetical protein LLS1_00710 [Leifsonia sp. LS1]|nr:hypothetical protein LLS1_00710 [Leifsonia sp. LS1]
MGQSSDLPEWSAQGPVIELAEERCWHLVQGVGVGRLGLSHDDVPEIFPVDYFTAGHSVLFRTSDGSKLRHLLHNASVVFEVDSLNPRDTWSVSMHGVARVKDDDYENRDADDALPAWSPVKTFRYVELQPTSITGRYFEHHVRPARIDENGRIIAS